MKTIEVEASGDLLEEFRQLLSRNGAVGELVVSRKTLRNALRRFVDGDIEAAELVEWASLIEAYDQIVYEPGFERIVAAFVFRFATPEINDPLDRDLGRRMIDDLAG